MEKVRVALCDSFTLPLWLQVFPEIKANYIEMHIWSMSHKAFKILTGKRAMRRPENVTTHYLIGASVRDYK